MHICMYVCHFPATKLTMFWAIFLLNKDISTLINNLGDVQEKNNIDISKYVFFMSQ